MALELFERVSSPLVRGRSFFGTRTCIGERGLGFRQRLACVVASLLRAPQRSLCALGNATCLRLGAPGRLQVRGSFAPCLGKAPFGVARGGFARRPWLPGAAPPRRRAGDGSVCAEADVAKLSVKAAVLGLRACVLVERRGVKRVGHALEHRRRQLMPFGAQQAARSLKEPGDRCALALARLAQGTRVTAPGEEIRLRPLKRIAGIK